MRRRLAVKSRYCRICHGWHDLEVDWPFVCRGHFQQSTGYGLQIIKDIEPYNAVAVDVATGKPPLIGGRAQHREFLKRNGYIEVGNEKQTQKPEYAKLTRNEIKRAYEEVVHGQKRR